MTRAGSLPSVSDIKLLLSAQSRPLLHDAVSAVMRQAIATSTSDTFSVTTHWAEAAFRQRVNAYDQLFGDCVRVESLLAWWGDPSLRGTLTLGPKRVCDSFTTGSGNSGWLALRWYPAVLLFYAGGIAALAAERYDNLYALMNAGLVAPDARGRHRTLSVALMEGVREISPAFKFIEGFKDRYTPMSDHLCVALKSPLDELFHMGSDYERCFDRFEVLLAMEHLHHVGDGWAPMGRFAWKTPYRNSSPLHLTLEEAEQSGASWPPLAAGLFGGSVERLAVVAAQLKAIAERRAMW